MTPTAISMTPNFIIVTATAYIVTPTAIIVTGQEVGLAVILTQGPRSPEPILMAGRRNLAVIQMPDQKSREVTLMAGQRNLVAVQILKAQTPSLRRRVQRAAVGQEKAVTATDKEHV